MFNFGKDIRVVSDMMNEIRASALLPVSIDPFSSESYDCRSNELDPDPGQAQLKFLLLDLCNT